jgi:glycosyltransferase involved in cell wall biosynthesis
MPVFNSNPYYFGKAIEALLGQEFGDFELVLSDNGSDDDARQQYEDAARRDRRIRYIRHPQNRGAIFNFDFVFTNASGEYFMWAADDDLYDPTFLARTVPQLRNSAESVTASSAMRFIDNAGDRIGSAEFSPASSHPLPTVRAAALLAKHVYMDIYALHRRAALERTRRLRPMFGADYVFVLEMLMQGSTRRVPEELFSHRMHRVATPEYVWGRLLGDGSPTVPKRGLLRRLAGEFGVAVTRSSLSWPAKVTCLSMVAGVLAVRGRRW